jgi:hypothetical protein
MKNGSYVPSKSSCYKCNVEGYYCTTPEGGEYNTCPLCNNYDYMSSELNKPNNERIYDFDVDVDDMRHNNEYPYCNNCNIIYRLGCIHSNHGCTDSIFNCHMIKKWKLIYSDQIFEGMPIFDDSNDWYNNANNIIVLELWCTGNKCSRSHYQLRECFLNKRSVS